MLSTNFSATVTVAMLGERHYDWWTESSNTYPSRLGFHRTQIVDLDHPDLAKPPSLGNTVIMIMLYQVSLRLVDIFYVIQFVPIIIPTKILLFSLYVVRRFICPPQKPHLSNSVSQIYVNKKNSFTLWKYRISSDLLSFVTVVHQCPTCVRPTLYV